MRELLGIKPSEQESSLYQTINLDVSQNGKNEKSKRAALVSGKDIGKDQEHVRDGSKPKPDKGGLHMRKGQAQPPAGAWQQFVAWIPNGAALQNPEPWKP